jgi:hypothetical protein
LIYEFAEESEVEDWTSSDLAQIFGECMTFSSILSYISSSAILFSTLSI